MQQNDFNKLINKLKLPNILGRDKYFHSVVLVPFIWIDNEYHILLEKRAAKISQGGEICFPGGGFDHLLDLNIFDTALRETTEELGIDSSYIEAIKQFDSIINPLGSIIDVIIGKIDAEALEDYHLNPDEVDDILLVPLKWLKENLPQEYKLQVEIHSKFADDSGKEVTLFPAQELNIPQRYHNSWKGHSHKVYAWQYEGETIWGVTAEILVEILKLATNKNEQCE